VGSDLQHGEEADRVEWMRSVLAQCEGP